MLLLIGSWRNTAHNMQSPGTKRNKLIVGVRTSAKISLLLTQLSLQAMLLFFLKLHADEANCLLGCLYQSDLPCNLPHNLAHSTNYFHLVPEKKNSRIDALGKTVPAPKLPQCSHSWACRQGFFCLQLHVAYEAGGSITYQPHLCFRTAANCDINY